MSLNPANQRLVNEIQLLQRCEKLFKLRAKPIIDQLIADSDRPLPDRIPPVPEWVRFAWPESGGVNLEQWWRERDRHTKMMGPYL